MKNIRFFTERLNIADMQFSDCDYAAKNGEMKYPENICVIHFTKMEKNLEIY